MASHAVGARFHALIGAPMLSFYDWYADLPIASPQVFGDQTDVPESGDWWDAAYLMLWGSNVPVTRTPDAHWMAEARYRGQKVVVVSPDYADATKFADEWLHPHPGTDGALAMAMGHVILRECFVDRQVPYFTDYVKRFTDLPFLVSLDERTGDTHTPGAFVTAKDLDLAGDAEAEARRWMPVLLDKAGGRPTVPNGTLGDRWSKASEGRWNLDLGEVDPLLSLCGRPGATRATVTLPRFDEDGATIRCAVPALRVGGRLVTTVFDLMLAQYGVRREGLDGPGPTAYDDASAPCTPAWQEAVTSVPAGAVVRAAREFARPRSRPGAAA
ncbi:nitrate reductase [Streptomyces alboflavus]|uniref:Nitrate reductase n=1 Tax=Streptomyces alboflavus TaxID=67267 RepID=A0A1Z1WSA8_9ACTN|nr:nitrate reductase [Streptomyces alboflavus]